MKEKKRMVKEKNNIIFLKSKRKVSQWKGKKKQPDLNVWFGLG
jgi:hypothetical protein